MVSAGRSTPLRSGESHHPGSREHPKQIAISSISLVELIYLVDKVRLPQSAYDELKQALNSPVHVLTEAVLSAEIAQATWQIPRDEVPDMPDRIVAATALHLRVPVISRGRRIRGANLSTIW